MSLRLIGRIVEQYHLLLHAIYFAVLCFLLLYFSVFWGLFPVVSPWVAAGILRNGLTEEWEKANFIPWNPSMGGMSGFISYAERKVSEEDPDPRFRIFLFLRNLFVPAFLALILFAIRLGTTVHPV